MAGSDHEESEETTADDTSLESLTADNLSDDNGAVNAAPDGGWGWVIVFSVFMGNFLIDGTIGSFGFYYPEFIATFGSSPSMTSMAGSIIVAVYLGSGPFVGSLIHRYGCRRVCFVGGCIGAAGLAVSTMSKSIVCFILTYGVIGGLGLGMNALSGHVMVNTYFNEKRGIANGIVSSGAGFGVFILAPTTQVLLQTYDWRGAMLITGGIVMQFCVCAMLMRPLIVKSSYISDNSETSAIHSEEETPSDYNKIYLEQPLLQNKTIHTLIGDESLNSKHNSNHLNVQSANNLPMRPRCDSEKFPIKPKIHINTDDSLYSANMASLPNLAKVFEDGANAKHAESHGRRHQKHEKNDIHFPHHHHHASHNFDPLMRKDIFYSGSLHHLKEYTNAESVSAYIEAVTIIPHETDEKNGPQKHGLLISRLSKRLRSYFDFSIFQHSVFIPMLIGGAFIQMAQFIPNTFIPENCYSLGIERGQVSIIVALFGVANICGRLSAGCLANVRRINPLWLCTMGTFMCGVCCALYPLCKTFPTMCAFMIGYGYFVGYFPPLQVLVMVEYLGLDKLTSAVGILQLVKGPAAMIGPPLAGVVYEWTQNYAMSVEVAAVLFLAAAGVQSLVPIINRCSTNKGNNSKDANITIIVSET